MAIFNFGGKKPNPDSLGVVKIDGVEFAVTMKEFKHILKKPIDSTVGASWSHVNLLQPPRQTPETYDAPRDLSEDRGAAVAIANATEPGNVNEHATDVARAVSLLLERKYGAADSGFTVSRLSPATKPLPSPHDLWQSQEAYVRGDTIDGVETMKHVHEYLQELARDPELIHQTIAEIKDKPVPVKDEAEAPKKEAVTPAPQSHVFNTLMDTMDRLLAAPSDEERAKIKAELTKYVLSIADARKLDLVYGDRPTGTFITKMADREKKGRDGTPPLRP